MFFEPRLGNKVHDRKKLCWVLTGLTVEHTAGYNNMNGVVIAAVFNSDSGGNVTVGQDSLDRGKHGKLTRILESLNYKGLARLNVIYCSPQPFCKE